MPDQSALHAALITLPGCAGVKPGDLKPLHVAGIAHDHVHVRGLELGGKPALLRVPRLSQWGLAPEANLAYQRACFERAAPSGATPALLATLPVSAALPMGALVVEAIAGRKPKLPGEMAAIAASLARLHHLPVPPPDARPPLQVHADAVAGTLNVIEEQAGFVDDAGLAPAARAAIADELDRARGFAREAAGREQPLRLVATDAHPGNFLIDARGRAILVDLEKALYGAPAIDLAHASLPTSTLWDPDIATELAPPAVAAFYRAYLDAAGAPLAAAVRPWIQPMRRLTWLRTLTWCVRWRVLSARDPDWSAASLAPDFRAHLERILPRYFDADSIAAVRAGFDDETLVAAIAE